MKPCELQTMLSREWHAVGQHLAWTLAPEARVVTGRPMYDAHIHRIQTEYGIELDIKHSSHEIIDYRVVDDKKFMWFVLRWS